MDELFLYDRDKGLFKTILNKSKVMQGRYFISPSYGHDLNTSNLASFINDPLSGLSDVKQKYPCVVTLPPKSVQSSETGGPFTDFVFPMFFLCTTYRTGQNQTKMNDRDTNTSGHHIWYDWKDMREVCYSFVEAMRTYIRSKTGLRAAIKIADVGPVTPISRYNNDDVTGVSVYITMTLADKVCNNVDYDMTDLLTVEVPNFDIHPAHKH